MRKPSEKRFETLSVIRDFFRKNGYSPTVQEIRKGCHSNSMATIQYHLAALEREGHIQRIPGISRNIRLVEVEVYHDDLIEVPVLGTIAAGEPIPVPNSESWSMTPDEVLRIDPDLARSGVPVYALRVKGTSMIDALIDDGDLVLMESAQSVQDGDTVAVWIKSQEEVTLKKIYREKGQVRLQPANPLLEPIYLRPDDVIVQGKLRAVIRKVGR